MKLVCEAHRRASASHASRSIAPAIAGPATPSPWARSRGWLRTARWTRHVSIALHRYSSAAVPNVSWSSMSCLVEPPGWAVLVSWSSRAGRALVSLIELVLWSRLVLVGASLGMHGRWLVVYQRLINVKTRQFCRAKKINESRNAYGRFLRP